MKKILAIYLAMLIFPSIAEAGFFGPENYEECVLNKMKGQNESMVSTAQKICEKKFPYVKELPYYKDRIKTSWSTKKGIGVVSENDLSGRKYDFVYKLHLSIIKNDGEYYITRYQAGFSTKSCSEIKSQYDYTLVGIFKFKEQEQSASIRSKTSAQYKCMRTDKIWGKLK